MALDLEPIEAPVKLDLEPLVRLDLEPMREEPRATLGDFLAQEPAVATDRLGNPLATPTIRGEGVTQLPATERGELEAQVPPGTEDIRLGEQEATVPRFGKPGTLARGASDVMGGLVEWALNKPEEALATLTPVAPAIAARYAPEIAVQFVKDVKAGVSGDREALGRALTMAALVGGTKALKRGLDEIKVQGAPARELPDVEQEAISALTPRPGEMTPRDLRYLATTRPPVIEELPRVATGEPAAAPGEVVAPERMREGQEDLAALKRQYEAARIDGNGQEMERIRGEMIAMARRMEGEGRAPVGIDITGEGGVRFGPEFWDFRPGEPSAEEVTAAARGTWPPARPPKLAKGGRTTARETTRPAASTADILPAATQTFEEVIKPAAGAAIEEATNASKEQATATVHGDLRAQPEQGAGEVPVAEGGEGVQPQTAGRVSEAPLASREDTAPAQAALAQAMARLPEDIRKEIGQVPISVIEFPAAMEGSGAVYRKGRVFYEEGEPISVDTIEHELLHKYVLQHEELVDPNSFQGMEKAVDQLQARLKRERASAPNRVAESEVSKEATGGAAREGTPPEIIGMGGAVPGEFEPAARTATGIKNATVDKERALRGLPPAMEPTRRGWGEVWDRAMADIDRDPGVQDRLISELAERPRALTDREDALLLHRQIDLQNDYGKATRELAQAVDDGRTEDAQMWRERLGQVSDGLKVLYDVEKASGTETGRGLAARKMLANERFELASMEMELRGAKGGEPLTEAERADLAKRQAEIAQEEKRLEQWKARAGKKAAEMEAQIAAGKAVPRTRRPPVKLDKEGLNIAFRLKKLKEKWNELLLKEQLKREEFTKRVVRRLFESSGMVRGLLSSLDLSAVLRQGKFAVIQHPIVAAKAMGPMLKAFASEEAAFKVEHDIMTRPNTQRYLQSGLALTDVHSPTLTRMEEVYSSRLLEYIPGVAGSARAYTTFLNKMRADTFDVLAATLGDGSATTDRVIANSINVFTGRGKLPFKEQSSAGLNAIFYAPRFVASRFQSVLGQPLYHGLLDRKVGFEGTAKARALVAGEYGKLLAGYAVIYGLAQAAGFKVGADPNSSDFGKIIMGKTRLDPLAGVSQVSVLMSRLYTGHTTTQRGRDVPIRGKVPFGQATTADIIWRFLRQKFAPLPQLFMDVTTQKFVTGEPVTAGELVKNYTIPISYQDALDTMEDAGVPAGTALTVLSIFGENVQTYTDRREGKARAINP